MMLSFCFSDKDIQEINNSFPFLKPEENESSKKIDEMPKNKMAFAFGSPINQQ